MMDRWLISSVFRELQSSFERQGSKLDNSKTYVCLSTSQNFTSYAAVKEMLFYGVKKALRSNVCNIFQPRILAA
jgi:hypothetical protein